MGVAGHSQVARKSQIEAKPEVVVAVHFRVVVHELKLALLFGQRAVALVGTQAVAKFLFRVTRQIEVRQARSKEIVVVQTRNAGILGRAGAQAIGQHVHTITHESEAQFRRESWVDCVVVPYRQALIQNVGGPGERYIVEVLSACQQSESSGSELVETGVAVAAENRRLVVNVVVPAGVPLITVECLRARGDVIVTVWEPGVAHSTWPWDQLQNVLRLRVQSTH